MNDDSLDETTDRGMINEETLSLTSPLHNDDRLDMDIDEWAISSRHNLSNRNETISSTTTNLESSQGGRVPNDKLDDGPPFDETADSVFPFSVKQDIQMAWSDIETRRRNMDRKRDKLKRLREKRGRREGAALDVQRGIDATVDALITTPLDAPFDHGKNTTLITGSQAGSVHLTNGGDQEVRLVRLV